MPDTYTVKAAKNAGEKDNPHGGTLVKWYLTVADPQGNETEDVYCQKKPENPLAPGDDIYGTLKEGEYGWRLHPEQRPEARQNGSQRSGDTRDTAWFDAKDKRISRAGILQAVVSSGVVVNAGGPPGPRYVEAVNELTDVLLASLDERTPHPNDVAGGSTDIGEDDGASSPPNEGAVASSVAISDKQQAFLERLLKEKGADSEQTQLIIGWASEKLTGERGGSASLAIDGLKGSDPDETLERLLKAALAWQRTQTDIPADTTGLDEGEKALDDIPF